MRHAFGGTGRIRALLARSAKLARSLVTAGKSQTSFSEADYQSAERSRVASLLAPAAGRSGSQVELQDWSSLDAGVSRIMQAADGKAPLSTQWIAQSLSEANGREIPAGSDLREFLEDRVARGQKELAARRRGTSGEALGTQTQLCQM